MPWLWNIAPVIMLLAWLLFAVKQFFSAGREAGWKRFRLSLASLLVAVGATGFFGSFISASGGLDWLPESFEWPIGLATGVVSTGDHFFAVPHPPSGRVQIYDSDWKFVNGWNVDAGGGTFRLFTSNTNQVNVVTSRGRWHYVFDLRGKLLAKENYPLDSNDPFPKQGASYTVRTAPWLWVFTNPFCSWLGAAAGMGLFIAERKLTQNTTAKTTKPE